MLRIRKGLAATLVLCVVLGAVPAMAESITPEQVYEKLFTEPLQEDWFVPEILAQLSLEELQGIVNMYTNALGAYERAEGVAPNFRLFFEHGTTNSVLVMNEAGKIAGLWFGMPELTGADSLEEAVAPFAELPGDVSLVVISNAGVLAALNPDMPLAVGSAFKLAVLAALKDLVAAGQLAWDDVITLEDADKSLPTGILQEWPAGTALTVESLAALMISQSDNTATDILLRLVGRELVEMYAPRNKPLLSTRELFALKNPANAELLTAFRQGDEAQRRALLEKLASAPLPDASVFAGGPRALDIEWYFTVTELAQLIARVADLPLMSINPGLVSKDDWSLVAFKGGSEPGVLNLTTLVVSESGTTYIVSATWNNPEQFLDEMQFFTLVNGIFNALKKMETATAAS